MKKLDSCWILIVCVLVLSGCASDRPTITDAAQTPDGRVWLVGTNGFAASRLRDGGLTRMKYAVSGESCGLSEVWTVVASGTPWLITCKGEVMRVSEDHERWEPIAQQPILSPEVTQEVRAVVVMPSGEIVVELLSAIGWWKPGEPKVRWEQLPLLIDNLTVLGDELYGIARVDAKGTYALVRRARSSVWEEAHLLPSWASIAFGVLYVGERLYVPTRDGLLAQKEHIGELEVLRLDGVVKPQQPELQQPVQIVSPASQPAEAPTSAAVDPLASPRERTRIRAAFALPDGRAVMSVEGLADGLVMIDDQGLSFWPCGASFDPPFLNVFLPSGSQEEGLLLVRTDGSLWRANEAGCQQVAPEIR